MQSVGSPWIPARVPRSDRDMTSSPIAAPPAKLIPSAVDHHNVTAWSLKTLLVVDILLQRVAVPVGTGVSIMLPVTLLVAAVLVQNKSLLVDVRHTRLYICAMAAATAAALTAYSSGPVDVSFTSWLLLVCTYLPFCLVVRQTQRAIYEAVLDSFIGIVSVVAVLALVQYASQLLGWTYQDLLADVVPPKWLLSGFNTSYPLQYGSPIYKSNAFVCLEPSACSQLLGLAILAHLRRGGSWRRILVLSAALLTTVSGTGVLILGAGLVGLSVKKGLIWTLRLFLVSVIAILALSLTPAFSLYSSRATEAKNSDTSGSLRFVQPYTNMWTEMADTHVLFLGQGPGYGDRQSKRYIANTGLPLQYGTLPKLVVEYGIVAAVIFLSLILTVFTSGPGGIGLKAAVLVFYFVLGGNLLAPGVVYLCLILTGWFSASRSEPRIPPRRAALRDGL
jgi:hypothetical protein